MASEKKVLRARRTRGPKMVKNPKPKKSNRYSQNVSKVQNIEKTLVKIQKHRFSDQNHKGSLFLLILGPKRAPYGAPFKANRALLPRFGAIGLLIFVPHLYGPQVAPQLLSPVRV